LGVGYLFAAGELNIYPPQALFSRRRHLSAVAHAKADGDAFSSQI
jgi:hypothetical protein